MLEEFQPERFAELVQRNIEIKAAIVRVMSTMFRATRGAELRPYCWPCDRTRDWLHPFPAWRGGKPWHCRSVRDFGAQGRVAAGDRDKVIGALQRIRTADAAA